MLSHIFIILTYIAETDLFIWFNVPYREDNEHGFPEVGFVDVAAKDSAIGFAGMVLYERDNAVLESQSQGNQPKESQSHHTNQTKSSSRITIVGASET